MAMQEKLDSGVHAIISKLYYIVINRDNKELAYKYDDITGAEIGDPNKGNVISRTSYYTNIRFNIDGKNVIVPMKVDTGAAHTVVGFESTELDKFIENIESSGYIGEAV